MPSTRINCRTLFDVTATGVRSHYRESQIPFEDAAGQHITNLDQWNRARNQQRNLETLHQIISLRTLPENISLPTNNNAWCFEFDVPNTDALGDDLSLLLADCAGVPMITGLGESETPGSYLQPNINIWFSVVVLNNDEDEDHG